MQTTRSNPFATLAALILGSLFFIGLALGILFGIQHGLIVLPPAQFTVQPAVPRPLAPATEQRPSFAPPAIQPQAQPAPAPVPVAPTAGPVYQPTGDDVPVSGEAVPAGAPMTEEYKATINAQQRMNDKGEFCAPRSGCSKPGAAGPLPWPEGR